MHKVKIEKCSKCGFPLRFNKVLKIKICSNSQCEYVGEMRGNK